MNLLVEGKTKSLFEVEGCPHLVFIKGKDRITAFDGGRSHVIEGKAAISNDTNAKIFTLLNESGIKTSFLKKEEDKCYLAKKCEMIPIEWVTRRIATGSFLKRNPGVEEGYMFSPPKLETFFKDDAKNDPQWSKEQILEAKFEVKDLIIGKIEYEIMAKTTIAVFEVLERAWDSLGCTLIDMKIEFGVDTETQEILVSDTIDSDSWRLWPSGDKRLMKDKQVYRNLKTVTHEDLDIVKKNFQWVADKLEELSPKEKGLAVILMGSVSDSTYAQSIAEHCAKLGVKTECRIASAHKGTSETLQIVAEYESLKIPLVFIAVAGRSNGLGPVISGNSVFPVVNCPPLKENDYSLDIWSSLKVPSGLGCTTVLYPEAAAQAVASIFALHDHEIWSKLRVKQLYLWKKMKSDEKSLNFS